MDWDRIQQKLHILSDAAKYDVSCSSSGSRRANQAGGIGNGAVCGICHTWSADGRCVSLLKILMTNRCIYDCAYCVNAASREAERAILTPEEIADVTIAFYRRNYIEGLFLSSGVYRSPDYTTELLIRTARILRDEKKFNGYIHMKGIPGTSAQLIRELGRYVDRLSVNIELPSAPSLRLLAPQKTKENILGPMGHIRQGILERREEKKHHKKAPSFVPAGQTTQLIVGATPDSDRTILRLSQALYDKVELKRVYYSAYVPAVTGPTCRPSPSRRSCGSTASTRLTGCCASTASAPRSCWTTRTPTSTVGSIRNPVGRWRIWNSSRWRSCGRIWRRCCVCRASARSVRGASCQLGGKAISALRI